MIEEHEIGTVTPFTKIILFLCLNSTLSHLMHRLEQLKLITILEILTLPPEIPRRQNRKAKYLKD